jgi:MinD-like ATPase involved in chromosome partitioning or flagellar assembly
MSPHVVIVGADKGGVGKTTISRTLMDYFAAHGITHRAFDTETPDGVLRRFHATKTKVVDLTASDDQMKVFDTLRETQVTLIDIRAGLLSRTLRTLSEIGFLDGVKEGRLRISVVHVIGSSQASFDEIQATAALVEGAKHHLVVNRINDSKFIGLSDDMKRVGAGAIEIAKLNELAADTVDRLGVGFDAFIADHGQSETLRGYVRAWLKRSFAAYDSAALNAS